MLGVRRGEDSRTSGGRHGRRPVLLATMGVRIDPTAERMAFDTALDAGTPLVVVNVVRLPPFVSSLALHGPDGAVLPHEDDREAVRATAQRAVDRGIETELLRVFTTRPARALAELVQERDAALLVVGPDATRVRRSLVRRAVRAVRDADCLVWIAPDGYCT
jgi:nucleotide-binding universal stress UspA family protein